MKKLVLALLIVATLLCVVSCGGEKTPDVPKFDAVELAGWQDYTVVYPDEADIVLSEAFSDLAKAIKEKYGTSLKMISDFIIPSETVPVGTLEILIGETNRPESANAIALIKSEDFIITQENNRLVITGGNSSSTAEAVQFYISYMLGENGLQFPEEAVIVNEKYPLDKLTVGGVDISEFVIVRGTNLSTLDRSLISLLQRKISLLCGVNVPCVAANTPEQKHEIIFGKTNREASKFDNVPDGTASFRQTEDKLSFYGNGENSNGAMVRYLVSVIDEIEGGKSYDIALEDFEAQPYTLAHLTGTSVPAMLSNNTQAYNADFSADPSQVYERFKLEVAKLPEEITVLDPYEVENFIMLSSHQVFVATNGDDSNPGTIDAPVATIAAAAKKLGSNGGIIYLRGGAYDTTNWEEITVKGTAISPVFIMPYQDEKVSLSAGKQIPASAFKPLDPNDAVGARIPADSKANVAYVNVFDLGWTKDDIGSISESSIPSLYINNTTGEISRFPNSDEDLLYFTMALETGSVSVHTSGLYPQWLKRVQNWQAWLKAGGTDKSTYVFDRSIYTNMAKAIEDAKKLNQFADTQYVDAQGNLNIDMSWSVKMVDLTPFKNSWQNTGDIWYYGNVYSGWKYDTCLVEFDKSKTAIVSKHGVMHGAAVSGNSPTGYNNYYLFNIIEALDKAGEWYLDKTTGNLYVYKTDDFDGGNITYCGKETDILKLSNCENVIVDGFVVKFGGAKGINVLKCDNVVVQRCTVSQIASQGVHLNSSERCAVIYNELFDTADYPIAIYVASTTRSNCSLTRHVIQNNYIHSPRFSMKYGINVGGFQTVVSHNRLIDCGIVFAAQGFDCIVEYNDISGGSLDTMDCGLIYCGGLGNYANHVRYNYLHDWNSPNTGIYFDSMSSFNYGYYNMIDTTEAVNLRFVRFLYSSTGHYNVFFGNICVGREPDKIYESCLFYNEKSSAYTSFDGLIGSFVEETDSFKGTSFASHYPEVVNYRNLAKKYLDAIKEPTYKRNELEVYLRSPGGNYISSNIVLGSDTGIESALAGMLNDVTGKPATVTSIMENNFIGSNPAEILKDYANGDFTVIPEMVNRIKSEAPGFKQLSTADTGLTYER